MGRGDALLALGDVASARLFYELALDHGHARAATAIGKTYDPLHLRQLGVHGAPANKAKAIEWYKQAIRAGDTTATLHLKILSQNQD
jgi:TPR repeat protein